MFLPRFTRNRGVFCFAARSTNIPRTEVQGILEKEVEKMKKIDYLLFNSAGFLGGFCGFGCFRLGFRCIVISNLLIIGIRIS